MSKDYLDSANRASVIALDIVLPISHKNEIVAGVNSTVHLNKIAEAIAAAEKRGELMAFKYAEDIRQECISALLDCAEYDALMEGPRFKAWNRSRLDRLRKRYERERQ